MEEESGEHSLTRRQQAAHLCTLNFSLRTRFSLYLNPESTSESDTGIVGDYRGLAELVGFEYIEIKNFALKKNPTLELLDEWTGRADLEPTVGKLVEYLTKMERKDILSDLYARIVESIEHYEKRKAHLQASPLQDQTVSQSTFNDHGVDETRIMTTDDVEKGSPQYYDAFVCYNPEGSDLKFVKDMLKILENSPYNLKLFVPGRNDLPGGSAHTINASLIENRCRRMVIIMSPRYLQSQACDFQTKFAFCLSPGSRSKKLVPVLIEDCQVPAILRHVTMCDYTKQDLQEWIWGRLVNAIKAPLNSIVWDKSPNTLSEISLNISSSFNEINESSSSSSSSSSNTASSSRSSSSAPRSHPRSSAAATPSSSC
ncbi:myeloid differentiation primary response protein MyD88 [Patella vulgata]|uniref:myeloid differentiation primary response protein MyD88 n=1 Tax=Patella vulgata TaxID=6465 RepID=UPI00217FCE01|nr:myeloid differentiation primary response protein MyD88 [Patella vulgata]